MHKEADNFLISWISSA